MKRILRTGVLQRAKRNMRVSVGDTGTYSYVAQHGKRRTIGEVIEWDQRLYQSDVWDHLKRNRLEKTYRKATVYCWLFQNMTRTLAKQLDKALSRFPAYLGAMAIDFSNPLHLIFFRNSLIELYRFSGKSAAIFYSMHNEDPDLMEQEILEKQGFIVSHEDMGARRTIFDNYDELEHFRRVKDFAEVFNAFEGWTDDQSSDLTLYLEELHPRLFDILASAARTYRRAETTEDFAQAALSGRRFLEALADMLFPARKEMVDSFDVGKTKHKNRIWAYIKTAMSDQGVFNQDQFIKFGKEADRLFELFNSGLHHKPSRRKVQTALRDLALWTLRLVHLNPVKARRPYLAYGEIMHNFLIDAHKRHKGKKD